MLLEKHNGAADLDTAQAIAKEAGFDVSEADWLRLNKEGMEELSEEQLEGVSGGLNTDGLTLYSKHGNHGEVRAGLSQSYSGGAFVMGVSFMLMRSCLQRINSSHKPIAMLPLP